MCFECTFEWHTQYTSLPTPSKPYCTGAYVRVHVLDTGYAPNVQHRYVHVCTHVQTRGQVVQYGYAAHGVLYQNALVYCV